MSIWSRISNVFRGDRLNDEIDQELRSHIEEALAEGRDPNEVRSQFGPMLRHREESRDVRLLVWLDSLGTDLRRRFCRSLWPSALAPRRFV
jgi:hypothetical protein